MGSVATVYLIGAGPGDPGLLTVRGVECLRLADTVVYDHLANPALLENAVQADELLYVGKAAGEHSRAQEEINALLVAKARQGRVTARLKGGDPFVFGRGGEEALALAEAGVPFEVVPGVTAGIAAAAYAGIPVTHRTCNSVLTLVTGHEDPTKPASAIDWEAIARGGGTLAFYMGVRNLPGIVAQLLAAGRAADTPVALIGSGTLPTQQTVTGTLATIVSLAAAAPVRPPAVILVGDVVALRARLRWFDTRPLFGVTVVVTRARHQASTLAQQLAQQGAAVLQLPTIRIAPPHDGAPVRAVVRDLRAFDWLLFTSVNAVESLFGALAETGGDSRRLATCRVAAIGEATEGALRAHGIVPDLVPPRFTSEALFTALHEAGAVAGQRFLLPQADIAPAELADRLRQAGGAVTGVTAYRNLPADPDAGVLSAFREGRVHVVTFTSASTARRFAAMIRTSLGTLPDHVAYASIGPETTQAARAEGLAIDVEATPHTIPGLVQALVERFRGRHP